MARKNKKDKEKEKERTEIEVDMFEMKKAGYPQILTSGLLGPCTAIGIYDKKTRSGYMMHEANFGYANLDEKIKRIKRDYGNLGRLKVFVTGGSAHFAEKEEKEAQMKDRDYVKRTLERYFKKDQMKIEWMPENKIARMHLDTETGRVEMQGVSLEKIAEMNEI